MEFSFASNGNVIDLRRWLLSNPRRVNLSNPTSQYTLLHTAVVSQHFPIVAMLLNEFNADPLIPCGGTGNTAVHAAALSSNAAILSALLERCGAMKANRLGEFPLDMAEELARKKYSKGNEECVALLRAHLWKNEKDPQAFPLRKSTREVCTPTQLRNAPAVGVPVPTGRVISKDIRDTIRDVRITTDSEVSHKERLRSHSSQERNGVRTPLLQKRYDAKSAETKDVIVRNERAVLDFAHLPMDLLAFRRSFGDAFEYTETTHILQVRGLLPHKYKSVVYFAPVIIVIDKHAAGGTPSPYRALIDKKNMGDLSINRYATYIDPCTGVIIPTSKDAIYGGLVEFVHKVIIKQFENTPPLTQQSDERKKNQESEPLFLRSLSERDAYFSILRQLSMFCDGGFGYDPAKKVVSVLVPIFFVAKWPVKSTESNHNRSHNGNGASHSREPLTVLPTETLMKLPVQMQFMPGGDFLDPPRVYLRNATNTTAENRINYAFLNKIIMNSASGEVQRSYLTTLTEWRQHGSICLVLKELQKKVTLLLIDYVESGLANDQLKDLNGLNSGPKLGAGAKTAAAEDEGNDWLLVSQGTGFTPVVRSLSTRAPAQSKVPCERSKCVVCLNGEKTVLVMPCRHLTLCYACSQLYKDRIRDDMLCPICRVPIKELIEVFL